MKQTAVEWYNEQLNIYGDKAFNKEISLGEYHIKKQELLQQAKEMFKEQIKNACIKWYDGSNDNAAEQYYNETFKSENIVMFMTPENGEIESIILTDNPDCGVKGITFKSE